MRQRSRNSVRAEPHRAPARMAKDRQPAARVSEAAAPPRPKPAPVTLRLTLRRETARLAAARAERDAAEKARADAAVEILRLHAGYAAALDRCAVLMRLRDGLEAQNAALRIRLGREMAHG